jgi:hypothetical protein
VTVEDIEVFELPDPASADYEREETSKAFSTKQARFFRSVFMPTLASALDRVRSGDAETLRMFGDRLETGLTRRLASEPKAMHSFVQTIVLPKRP